MQITIKNLHLKTIIGIYPFERTKKQAVIINIKFQYNGIKAAQTDNIENAVDYKTINKNIIALVQKSKFFLLETLANHILKEIIKDKKIRHAAVEVAKPDALTHAESVSVKTTATRRKQKHENT